MTQKNTKLYFISDLHLGIPPNEREREYMFVAWLDHIKHDAKKVFLLGDIFDFWFSYKYVVPKGNIRVLGKIAELTDSGIEIHYSIGNHDMWIFDYFTQELGVQMHSKPIEFDYDGKTFMVGHGDGLGKNNKKYNLLKYCFSCSINQRIFAFLHPRIGISLANFCSRQSRFSHGEMDKTYFGHEKEDITTYCIEKLKQKHYDYFIFGHRHLLLDMLLNENTRYINLGEWVHNKFYAVYENQTVIIKDFTNEINKL